MLRASSAAICGREANNDDDNGAAAVADHDVKPISCADISAGAAAEMPPSLAAPTPPSNSELNLLKPPMPFNFAALGDDDAKIKAPC